jgi:tetratricopeptide (TPR) repeat protein
VALALSFASTARAQSTDETLARARELEQAGDVREAARLVEELAAATPEDFAVRLRAGWLALSEQRYDDAEAHYRAAVDVSDGNPEATLGLASARSGDRRFSEALGPAQDAAQQMPDSAAAHLELAWILFNLERYDDALASYRRVLELSPEHADAHAGAGWCLLRLGRTRQARAELDRALELDPDNGAAMRGQGSAGSGVAIDAGLRGLVDVGGRTPSTMWGGGVAASLGMHVRGFGLRAAYRYSQLQPTDEFVPGPLPPPGAPPPPPQAFQRDSYDTHFVAAGLDYAVRWFDVGVLGGYARAEARNWSAGLVALHLGATFRATLAVNGAVLFSETGTDGQVEARASFPIASWLDLWAGFLLTIHTEESRTQLPPGTGTGSGDRDIESLPAGEGGLRFHGDRWSLDVWGGYGGTVNRLVYHAPALYDFEEELFWDAGALADLLVSRTETLGVSVDLGFEVLGTRFLALDGNEQEGVLSLVYLGLRMCWSRGASRR